MLNALANLATSRPRRVVAIALACAVEDALRPFGVRVDELPMTPDRIVSWIEAAEHSR